MQKCGVPLCSCPLILPQWLSGFVRQCPSRPCSLHARIDTSDSGQSMECVIMCTYNNVG